MFNINGFSKNSSGAPIGAAKKNEKKVPAKNDKHTEKKEKNTDKADFSSFLGANKAQNGAGGLRVSAASEKTSGISQKAEAYLDKLKKKYGNMDFIIADYSTDEEADKLLSKGKGEYNVLITPDLLEKMADDEDTAAEYEAMIDKSVESIDGVREGLGEDADMVKKYGVTFDADGNMSIRAMLAGDLTASDGSSTVKASTVEEMLTRLKETKESQAEKLAKLREERKAEEEKELSGIEGEDGDITVIRHDNSDAAKRMNSVISKQKESEMQTLLESVNSDDDGSIGRTHAHFSAKA